MGFSPLHICMDSSSSDHWLQGTIHEESGMDSSSSPSGEMLTCSRPLMERRLRPPHDQALNCPRCDSTHTKFCYYNNYSLSQPRYFCKTCRRYWTKGGTLRNIPVGGGCRKNKKVSSKKSDDPSLNTQSQTQLGEPFYHHHHPKDLQLSFPPDMQFSHLGNFLGPNGALGNPNFGMLENPRPVDFMESKLEGIIDAPRNFDFMGNSDMSMTVGDHINGQSGLAPNFHGFCSSAFGGMSFDGGYHGGTNYMMDSSCQRLMLPYDHGTENDQSASIDVKPNRKPLSIDQWQGHQSWSTDAGKESFGYVSGLGSCSGMMNGNGYGSSTTNPLV